MTQPYRSVAPRRIIALSTVLLPLIQAGLWYLSPRVYISLRWLPGWYRAIIVFPYGLAPSLWTIGTPLSYLLICGMSAFYATGGLDRIQAWKKGALVGTMGGIGGVILATLTLAVLFFWFLQTTGAQVRADCTLHPVHYCGMGFGWTVVILLSLTVRPFPAINLLGLTLATLGGVLGGHFRAGRLKGDRPAQEWPGEKAQAKTGSREVLVVVIIAALLATLLGVSFILFYSSSLLMNLA
jgi:hypothetical protein